ncbi:MAG: hypothetical protein IMF18_07865 [Proteobacteria bacterium]|nr:hypothetical protein [Pseudomonadota bacterium]
MVEGDLMAESRQFELCVAQTVLHLPCFFPSVSSVKTNLLPLYYVELLDAAAHPLFLVSAYDIANSSAEHRLRMDATLKSSVERGTVILMDSGNYEGFWKGGPAWVVDQFHETARTSEHHLCFCYDNQEPPDTAEAIADDVIERVLRDQEHTIGTVVPIVHGETDLLADATNT